MASDDDRDWHVSVGLDFLKSDLTPCARSVWIALAYRARSKPSCFASTADIAALATLGEDTARRGLRELVRKRKVLRVMADSKRIRRIGVSCSTGQTGGAIPSPRGPTESPRRGRHSSQRRFSLQQV